VLPGIIISLPGYYKGSGQEHMYEKNFEYIKNNVFILFHPADIIDSEEKSRSDPGKVEVED
jgi:hypothetical protein